MKDCIESTYTLDADGYAHICYEGKRWYHHRLVYTQHYGDIPNGKLIRHTCDNRSCVNPEHLLIGTHQDNMRDRVERNRCAKGTKLSRYNLTEQDVLDIRLNKGKVTQRELANSYNVSKRTIEDIHQQKSWKHI